MKLRIAWLTLLPVLSLLLVSCGPPRGGPPVATVPTTTLQAHTIVERADYLGRLRALKAAKIYAQQPDYIKSIRVEPGQQVRAGQVLVELNGDQSRAQLASARAGVQSQQAAYKAAQLTAQASSATYLQAEADLALAKRQFERYQELYDQELISLNQLDEYRNQYERNSGLFAAARAQMNADQERVSEAAGQLSSSRRIRQ